MLKISKCKEMDNIQAFKINPGITVLVIFDTSFWFNTKNSNNHATQILAH